MRDVWGKTVLKCNKCFTFLLQLVFHCTVKYLAITVREMRAEMHVGTRAECSYLLGYLR
jgi:hypothetical protein